MPLICSSASIADLNARVFDQLKHVLECAGSSLAPVAQITIYLVDKTDAPGMNRVYARYFTAPPYPNRATVVVKELLGENCRACDQGLTRDDHGSFAPTA
ncbi:RidA family protein [Paraburkholderia sediminicola]|uniref:RidA family protein n=1 Tax=Paraburkholderia sediminicola TaxID=458836 RepID=UPI0038B946B4